MIAQPFESRHPVTQRLTARRLVEMLGNWRGGGRSYQELSDSIALLISEGAITAGTALPAERPLSDALGVSRTTVAASYQHLREAGLAQSRQGSGTVIRLPRQEAGELWSSGASEIDLSFAAPEPWRGLAALSAHAQATRPDIFRDKGFDTIGSLSLRRAIAERYTSRGLPTSPDQIMVTLGAQHAVYLIARTLLRRGDRSLIEAPSYPHAREALAATGALVSEIPVGAFGYDNASIVDIAQRTSPRLAYLIPDHHNPTGQSMPHELRGELITTLASQGAHIIADETTAELTLGGVRSVLPFAASAEYLHQQDSVITVGSLGKTVWGGLRVGWIRTTPELISRLEVSRRIGDLGTGAWEQVLAELALERYDEILAERSTSLTAQHRTLTGQLAAHFPDWSFAEVAGGVSLWVDLGGPHSNRLCRAGAKAGVRIVPGSRFGSPGVFERYLRIPFSASSDEIRESILRLRLAWGAQESSMRAELPVGAVV